ncbi:MAG: M3 family metallopeptidase, partial [Pseudohongiella sp.]|nr:M3 family metallopeptidase [Pseudohongiella sp.]
MLSAKTDINPLLQFDSLPEFHAIRAEHIRPAVVQVLEENRQQLESLLSNTKDDQLPDWRGLIDVLDEMDDRLGKVWSAASHLNAVCNTAEIREAYNSAQPLITQYYADMGQNKHLYQRVLALESRADELELDGSQRKILSDSLLDFRLAGVSLPEEQKRDYTRIQTRLSELSNTFGNNVLDATRDWSLNIEDVSELSGIPALSLQSMAVAAGQKGLAGYLLTLDFPCYHAVMTYADNRKLRETVYQAYTTRASSNGRAEWDNHDIIIEILKLRQEMSALLGFRNYAELSVQRKMAKSVDQVNNFLSDLISFSLPAAKREFEELQDYANNVFDIAELAAWDVSYFSEKLRKQNYDISQEELRAWFPLEQVRRGLFAIIETLYGIKVERNTHAQVWHTDVEFYDLIKHGEVIASFYVDLFTREGKRGGAWMASCRTRRMRPAHASTSRLQIPVAFLVCNFAPPSGDTPALLTHNDVTTLFHEFGHGLHHMLTRENYLQSSGIAGVAWDAVELPSQLMENWCWDTESIGMISGHFETGEKLPAAMLKKMLAARNFQSGMRSVRQLEFAHFDFSLHQTRCADDIDFVNEALQKTRALTSVYSVPAYNRFQNSFSHIFAGGYAAGYYSYKWAEVL